MILDLVTGLCQTVSGLQVCLLSRMLFSDKERWEVTLLTQKCRQANISLGQSDIELIRITLAIR